MIVLEIGLTDWHRILIGELPTGFLFEVILRTLIVFLILMVSMRLMGKRMASQLSQIELAGMVSLAAAIGVPVLAPEQGLLPALIIAAIVVITQRFISGRNRKNAKFESLTTGDVNTLVKNGVLQKKAMTKALISNERVKAQLRAEKLVHTGEVKRLYLEGDGTFSLVKEENPEPGLPILPVFDQDFVNLMTENTDIKICGECGYEASKVGEDSHCSSCEENNWLYAVKRRNKEKNKKKGIAFG